MVANVLTSSVPRVPERVCYALAALLASGCELLEGESVAPSEPQPTFTVRFKITGEDGQGLKGAQIAHEKTVFGTTQADGTATITLAGREGERIALEVRCPAPFDSPKEPHIVGLRHLAPGSPPPTFTADCTRSHHTFVVGIRTERGVGLPVIRLGQVVGKTDAFGAAHVIVEAAPNEQIALRLDTSAQRRLRPQSPTLTFVTGDKDELVLLEQKFNELRAKPKPRPVISRPTPL